MALKILILGINGFIGNSLAEQILQQKDWEVYGMDLTTDKLQGILDNPRLHFTQGDITQNTQWITEQVKLCDVVLPLVAIANPALYVQNPLRVFQLDFEANLAVIKECVRYKTRVVFPSTSEVYGMCPDEEFDEETSNFVLGPVNKPRWIYSCSKQLLDRVIHAYGMSDNLPYTLFRPFNWFGPKLDNILNPNDGGSRMATQFIGNILRGKPIQLVDGGEQKRSFTYVDDSIDALIKIIENKNGCADNQIFNIGNPHNEISVKDFAELVIRLITNYPAYAEAAQKTELIITPAESYFGKGYQDVKRRVPAIKKAQQILGWNPVITLEEGLRKTLDYHLAK